MLYRQRLTRNYCFPIPSIQSEQTNSSLNDNNRDFDRSLTIRLLTITIISSVSKSLERCTVFTTGDTHGTEHREHR